MVVVVVALQKYCQHSRAAKTGATAPRKRTDGREFFLFAVAQLLLYSSTLVTKANSDGSLSHSSLTGATTVAKTGEDGHSN